MSSDRGYSQDNTNIPSNGNGNDDQEEIDWFGEVPQDQIQQSQQQKAQQQQAEFYSQQQYAARENKQAEGNGSNINQQNQQIKNAVGIAVNAAGTAAGGGAALAPKSALLNSINQSLKQEGIQQIPQITAKTLSQDRNSKDSAIIQVCVERKRDSFNQVRAWDDKRTLFITKHKSIIDDILLRVDRRVQVSQESMSQVVRFFKERRDQEQTYFKLFSTKIPQLSTLWKDPTDPKVDWYPVLTQAFKETDQIGEMQGKNVQTLVLYLEKNIIRDLLFNENEDFEKKVKTLRGNIADQQSRLEKAVLFTAKKSNAYIQLYNNMMGPDAALFKQKKKRKDLLNVEIKFRQAAFDHIREEKELGQQILNYWEEARKIECNRLEVIQRAFQLYFTKHQETYGAHPQMQQTLLNFKKFETLKESGDHFSIAKILSQEATSSVKQTLNISAALTWQDLGKYFVNFNFKDMSITQHPLVQKKFKIMRDVGSVTKSFRECWMVATVDDILLFYDEIDQKDTEKKGSAITDGGKKVNNQPKKKFLLDYLKAKPREDPTLIDIIEKTPGLLFTSTNKQLIRFLREDDFEEFKVFMIRYQAGQQKAGSQDSSTAVSQNSSK